MSGWDNFGLELREFYLSRSIVPIDMPIESALEFQHALNHLFKEWLKKPEDQQDSNIQKAAGHIHRAHLDYLKKWLLEYHCKLKRGVAFTDDELNSSRGNLQKQANFNPIVWKLTLNQSPLKAEELYTLGDENRIEIFQKYRDLIYSIGHIVAPTSSPSSPVIQAPINPPNDSLSIGKLYWDWALLEAITAAVTGCRIDYSIDAVIKALEPKAGRLDHYWGDFGVALQHQMGTLSCHLFQHLNSFPPAGGEMLSGKFRNFYNDNRTVLDECFKHMKESKSLLICLNTINNHGKKITAEEQEKYAAPAFALLDRLYVAINEIRIKFINEFFPSNEFFGYPTD